MSTLKVNNLQVGQDSTATNNLTWFQPGSPDGTIRLGSGNAGSATTKFTFDKDGNLTCVGNITANSIIAPIEGTLDDWIVHAGDTDTKIGFPSDNAVDIYAGGKQVRLTSDGHLGINRTTPTAPITARRLDAGGTGTSGVIAEFANSSGYGVWFGQVSASGAAWGATTGDFYWNTGGLSSQVERLRITSTGQFHMGGGNSWTYASQKFVLVEPSNPLGMILQGNHANEGVNLTLQNIVNANNAYSSLSFADDGGQIFGIVRGKVKDKNANTGELQFWTSGSQKLTIDKDGDVGIGEASPGANNEKLTVREDIAAASGKSIISIYNLYQGTSGQGNESTGALEFTFKNHNAAHNWWGGRIGCYNTDNYNQYTYLRFDTASQGNAAGKMWLTHAGRLGVGTDNPDQILHLATTGTCKLRLEDKRTSIADNSQYGVIQFEHRDSNTPGVAAEIAALMTDTTNGATALQFTTGTATVKDVRLTIDSSGRVGIQGLPTKAHLEVRSSGGSNTMLTALFGANEGVTTGALSNNADKGCRIGIQHYSTSEEAFSWISAASGSSSNTINMGGGTSLMNAVTQMGFYTAANNTTTGGTERVRISPDGTFTKYLSTGVAQAAFGGSGQVNGITGLPSMAATPFVVGRDTGTNKSAHFGGHLQFNSGYGINFQPTGGSAAVSSDVFDDYEEGTWTPRITNSSGTDVGTYSWRTGEYTKVGNVCYCTMALGLGGLTAGSGYKLRGIPFNIAGLNYFYYVPVYGYNWKSGYGDSASDINIFLEVNSGAPTELSFANNSGKGAVSNSQIDASQRMTIMFWYWTA